ncbi:MAG: PAS domain-containing protein [Sulfurimonas sp.]|nr:PAS domain-containing protein [Sulfurimonas sp.]
MVRHPDMKKETYKDLWRTIKANKTWSGELKNKKKDGSFYWVDTIMTPKYSSNGNKTGYIAIRQDITDKKNSRRVIYNRWINRTF